MKLLFAFVLALAGVAASAAPFPPVHVEKINDRVYALLGPADVPNRENGGYMNNNLAIIGKDGVVLVDAGSHVAVAEHILQALRTVTTKPVTHVLITHHHADHHLGLAAFPGATVVSTDVCAREIAEHGKGHVAWMKGRTGLSLAGTRPVTPTVLIPAKTRRSMELQGVPMELIGTDTAHTHGDMMVWLPEDGVLASGDVLVHGINPNLEDGNLKKQIAVIDEALKLPLKEVMPGHGPLMVRADVEAFRGLLSDFYRTIETIYKAGGMESEVRQRLDIARWQKLGRFEDMMGHNISAVWRQVEDDNF